MSKKPEVDIEQIRLELSVEEKRLELLLAKNPDDEDEIAAAMLRVKLYKKILGKGAPVAAPAPTLPAVIKEVKPAEIGPVDDLIEFCKLLTIRYRPSEGVEAISGPFTPNAAQRRLFADLWGGHLSGEAYKEQILKARQLGFTTALMAFSLWVMHRIPGFRVMLIMDKDAHSDDKFELIKRWAKEIGFETSKLTRKSVTFANGSEFIVDSAESKNPGTSITVNALIVSELSKFPRNKADTVMTSLVPTVPEMRYSFVVLESTANGTNHYRRDWTKNKAGGGKFRVRFEPWYASTEYREKVPEDFKFSEDPAFYDYKTADEPLSERAYSKVYDLDKEQVYWRRLRLQSMPSLDDFDQEYPTTDEHAFRSSESGYIPKNVIEHGTISGEEYPRYRNRRSPSIGANWQSSTYAPDFVPDQDGNVWVRELPVDGQQYFLSIDIAEGIQNDTSDTDYTSVTVVNDDGVQVARYHARTRPEDIAQDIIPLLRWYNNAWVIGEKNGVGTVALVDFLKASYPKMYEDQSKQSYEYRDRVWFRTNSNKKVLLEEYVAFIKKDPSRVMFVKNCAEQTLEQYSGFVKTSRGKLCGMPGIHDDQVMSDAFAYECMKRYKVKRQPAKPPAQASGVWSLDAPMAAKSGVTWRNL